MSTTTNTDTNNSADNVYWVPLIDITTVQCLGNEVLIGHHHKYYLFDADSEQKALEVARSHPGFVDNYNKLTPMERKKITPFLIDLERSVKQVLPCKYRFRNRQDQYTCGEPLHDLPDEFGHDDSSINMNGLYGMCCLLGYDKPEHLNCPYNNHPIRPLE
jgi:hypothetical protein